MESDSEETFEHLYVEKDDAPKHEKLVEKVLRLNKTQHLRKPSRTEPTLQISEFNLVKSIEGEKGSVHIGELTKSLKNRKSRIKISDSIKRLQKKSHTLPKPLEKPQANRIRRSVAYEKTALELDRWEATVTANRVSTNLNFPLNNDFKIERKEREKFPSMWRVKSKLAEELEKHSPNVEENIINLEEENKFPLTLKELLARRKEAAKLRAYQGYQEAKARRQNKIKSKKYHRIKKREMIKKKLKEFEQLQKTDPEEALKKLEEIEKARIRERFSLRHKSTGKWAKNQQIRAKYDKESRQHLAQQLLLSRELTQKSKAEDSDSENEEINSAPIINDTNNPWVNGIKPDKEVSDFINGYRKYWLEQNANNSDVNKNCEENKEKSANVPHQLKTTPKKKKIKKQDTKIEETPKSTSDWEVSILEDSVVIEEMFNDVENKLEKKMLENVQELKQKLKVKTPQSGKTKKYETKKVDLSFPIQKKAPQIDAELDENTNTQSDNTENSKTLQTLKNIINSEVYQKDTNINPEKYLQVKQTELSTEIPDILTTEENEEEDDQRAVISEAFEDDDILDDFSKDKENEIDKNKPKDIDLTLPGWGSWGGANIQISKRKRRRFIVKAPEKFPRKDDDRKFLIINEKAQSKIKEHMVSEIPFPFKTVKDFEASMRAPISNTFVPETAYRKLIKPAVTTKMGTIIEPISKDLLVNKSS